MGWVGRIRQRGLRRAETPSTVSGKPNEAARNRPTNASETQQNPPEAESLNVKISTHSDLQVSEDPHPPLLHYLLTPTVSKSRDFEQ